MPTHIYDFYKVSDEISRPWIPIKILNPASSDFITIMALLDTGADYCVFPKFVADQLKIDLKSGTKEEMQGLAESKIAVWKHVFRVHLLTPDRRMEAWKSKDLTIGVVEHDNIPPILGFCNFMCHFKITFNLSTKKIIINDQPKV